MCDYCMQHSGLGLFDAGSMQHVPVVRNAENTHIYANEQILREQDVTNNIDGDYEYSQPKTYLMIDNNTPLIHVDNPFDTPAQVALYYVQIAATSGRVQLTVDNNDQTALQNAADTTAQPGLLFVGSMNTAPPLFWLKFQEFVTLKTLSVAPNITVILVFRRRRLQNIPRNMTPFNDLSQ